MSRQNSLACVKVLTKRKRAVGREQKKKCSETIVVTAYWEE